MLNPSTPPEATAPYDNSSGMGSQSQVPPEILKWNWGAFFLNWIWSIGNGTFVGLLTFVPILGLFMPFVLGAKGSRWAWQNRRWESVAAFQRVQRRWAQVGAGLAALLVGLAALGFYFAVEGYKQLDIYTLAAQSLENDDELRDIVGGDYTIAATGFNLSGSNASFDFDITGPNKSTAVRVYVEKVRGKWSVVDSVLLDDSNATDTEDSGTVIDEGTCTRPPGLTV